MIATVSLAAGLVFGVAASSAKHQNGRLDLDLVDLVANQQQLVLTLEEEVETLTEQAQTLTDSGLATALALGPKDFSEYPVVGPGITVTLADADADFVADERISVNDLVVHQQDVEAVMNALWRGGAEAMTVQGVRIVATTPVRCIGNVILIGSRAYAPPYEISAIGDVNTLIPSVMQDPTVSQYRDNAARYQMGWSLGVNQTLKMPAVTGARSAVFAATQTGE